MKKLILATMALLLITNISFAQRNIKTETFKVYGECIQCKNRIEGALKKINTQAADWNIESKMLTVSYDSTKLTRTKIEKKLAAVGHDTESFKADDKVYNALPPCCFYERAGAAEKSVPALAAFSIAGNILGMPNGKSIPLSHATITDLHTEKQVLTDSTGFFNINSYLPASISISYAGYKTDTVQIITPSNVQVIMQPSSSEELSAVIVTSRQFSSYVSTKNPFNTLNIGGNELKKAACCNLSESFETSPSVDVSYTDAVTGIKQIQLLGLAGNYTQITTENTPEIQGLSSIYGLTFIPGPWIEGVQVTKGTGSVANGYESIAGQINVEEIKPNTADKVYVNGYANAIGRLEGTVNVSKVLNDKWSTALLTHVNGVVAKKDGNNDGFIDNPIGRQFNVINRWRFDNEKLFAQFSLKALNDHRQSGQVDFDPAKDKFTTNSYGVGIDVEKYAFAGKLGYVFPGTDYKSVGLVFSANTFKNQSYYGLTAYNGKQNNVYANLIYQSIIGSTIHKFRTGLSFQQDIYDENINLAKFTRKETVPGAFFEYTFTPSEKIIVIGGIRADYHNAYKTIITPRLNVKYDISPKTNLRLSAGSGLRTANIFAENIGLFASSRQYSILNATSGYGYGLQAEKAWNYGVNLVQRFKINNREASLSLDAYRTNFVNQVVVDVDASPQKILFYNLKGKSYSNTMQAELNATVVKNFDVRLAYRWLDVQTNYQGLMLQKPLTAKQRAFINLAYAAKGNWKFDLTTQWLGQKRLPNTGTNPADKQMPSYSPAFFQMSGQVTKKLGKRWEIYAGAENITNYKQQDIILAADQPFNPYFDASMVWGPVNGRMIYSGFRFSIK